MISSSTCPLPPPPHTHLQVRHWDASELTPSHRQWSRKQSPPHDATPSPPAAAAAARPGHSGTDNDNADKSGGGGGDGAEPDESTEPVSALLAELLRSMKARRWLVVLNAHVAPDLVRGGEGERRFGFEQGGGAEI